MSVDFPAPVAEFLMQPITAALVTLNADGAPQVTYVWYAFDGQRFFISTTTDRLKARNVQRDPRVALSMLNPQNPYSFVTLRGSVTTTKEGANELIRELAIRYQGPERGAAYAAKIQSPSRLKLTFDPDHLLVNGF